MKVEDYLKNEPPIKLAFIANKMYPEHKYAATTLNNKLKNVDGRKFTKQDSELAILVLKNICNDINKIKP
jgi:hypothetical protein